MPGCRQPECNDSRPSWTANVTLCVRRAAFTGNGCESSEKICFLADVREHFGACVLGDVVRYREGAVSARAFGMHAPLRDNLTIKVGKLLQKPDILKQLRSTQ